MQGGPCAHVHVLCVKSDIKDMMLILYRVNVTSVYLILTMYKLFVIERQY